MKPARNQSINAGGLFWKLSFVFFPCACWGLPAPDMTNLFINEISTTGCFSNRDENGEQVDWIEIYNPTGSVISLAGSYLTDQAFNLQRWEFPAIQIQPGEYLVVFASGKDRRPTGGGNQHTNFELDSEGEYLAIVDSASQVISELVPAYPPQSALFSYGFDEIAGEYRFMNPTPRAPNETTESFLTFFPDRVQFSLERGYYDEPQAVELSTLIPGSTIRFTTDGTTPGWATGTVYTGAVQIPSTRMIRAVALVSGVGRSQVETHTYFIGLPQSLKTLPALSIVSDDKNFNSPEIGIRVPPNNGGRGRAWERPASVEYLIPEASPGFQIDCGVRLHGLGSRTPPKQSMRLYFRRSYGEPELVFPFVPGSDVTRFKRLVLRAGWQDQNPFVNDELTRRLYAKMGHVSSRGSFVHLFVNGVHFGYYNPCERLDRFFFETYHGGGNDWDVIRSTGVLADGDTVVFDELLALTESADVAGLMDSATFEEVKKRLDVVNFADYILLNVVAGMDDWPHNNWAAARERMPGSRFRFYVWDGEQAFGTGVSTTSNTIKNDLVNDTFDPNTPIRLIYRGLSKSPEFRKLFAERYRKHGFGDGALTESSIMDEFLDLRGQMIGALPHLQGVISFSWIPGRRHNIEQFLEEAELFDRSGLQLGPTLVINEFMASNNSTVSDEGGDFDDWVEIHNVTDAEIDLSGMFLTDDLSNSLKWEIPAGAAIDAGGYLLIWTDGDTFQGPLHAPFRLNADGEEIGLFDTLANGNRLIDSVVFDSQNTDVSEGRRPDGSGVMESMPIPSPGFSNGASPSQPIHDTAFSAYQTGLGSRTVGAADFDRDGLTDIAVGNMDYGSVRILRNQGGGQFTPHANFQTQRVGLTAMTVGDFNGDSFPDLALAQDVMKEHTVSILINDGTGGFSLKGPFPFNQTNETRLLHPRSMQVADIDNDDDQDLLISSETSALDVIRVVETVIAFLENDGDGNLQESAAIPSGFADLFSPHSLVVRDLDGDGDLDFAAPSRGRNVNISLQTQEKGFAEPANIVIPGTTFAKLASVVGADFDNDLDVDLATCTGAGGAVHILTNDGNANFTLDPALTLGVFGAQVLLDGDFNLDGNADLALINLSPVLQEASAIRILVGKGDGTFDISAPLFTPDEVAFPRAMAIADFDGDLYPDLAAADEFNGRVSVFMKLHLLGPQPDSVEGWSLYGP